MIIGAITGALIFGGITFAVTVSLRNSFWRVIAITAGIAIAGAATVAGIVAVTSDSKHECPPGTVQADANNKLYSGCIPVDLAKKQVENQ